MSTPEEIQTKQIIFFATVLSLISAVIFTTIAYKDLFSSSQFEVIEPILPQNTSIVI